LYLIIEMIDFSISPRKFKHLKYNSTQLGINHKNSKRIYSKFKFETLKLAFREFYKIIRDK
jgi:hypothetical protein